MRKKWCLQWHTNGIEEVSKCEGKNRQILTFWKFWKTHFSNGCSTLGRISVTSSDHYFSLDMPGNYETNAVYSWKKNYTNINKRKFKDWYMYLLLFHVILLTEKNMHVWPKITKDVQGQKNSPIYFCCGTYFHSYNETEFGKTKPGRMSQSDTVLFYSSQSGKSLGAPHDLV